MNTKLPFEKGSYISPRHSHAPSDSASLFREPIGHILRSAYNDGHEAAVPESMNALLDKIDEVTRNTR